MQSAIRLRYRLLPYIYSGFYRVASEGYTMQRGLAFDFPASLRARTVADEFSAPSWPLQLWAGISSRGICYSRVRAPRSAVFGPALLVAPLVANASARSVYLPAPAGAWRGFSPEPLP